MRTYYFEDHTLKAMVVDLMRSVSQGVLDVKTACWLIGRAEAVYTEQEAIGLLDEFLRRELWWNWAPPTLKRDYNYIIAARQDAAWLEEEAPPEEI
jgi:hypothetical protein